MKNILKLFIGAMMLQSCIIIRTDRDGVYRNYDNSEKVQDFAGKPMESRDFEVKKFSEIKANSAMKVYIKKAAQQKVVVSSNAINYIVVSSENGILKVEYNNQNNSINNLNAEITVYTPDFEKLSASSAGQIFINDDFQLNKLKINLDSAGKVMGNIFAEKLFVNVSSAAFLESKVQSKIIEIDASSASKVNLSGSTEEIKINANSVAKINLENLKYKNIQQESSSLAKIYVK